jgi:hypothetical protein
MTARLPSQGSNMLTGAILIAILLLLAFIIWAIHRK